MQMTDPSNETRENAWLLLRAKAQEEKIKKAFELFREGGVEPVLIKGWAAASVYPQKSDRLYADIDLCVDPDVFAKARLIAENESVRKLNVDLHCGLRHLDTISWDDLYKNSRLIELGDSKIRILRPEDHLRVLCVHWLNDGGAYKKKLLDVFYAVQNRPADFDWDRCLGVVGPRRRKWIVSAIGLARRYYGLSLENTPIEKDAEEIPGWIIRAVEKEWKSDVRLRPLLGCLHDKKQLKQQILKRLPPNPIQATVEMEGSFDEGPRIFYQLGDFFKRAMSALKDLKELKKPKKPKKI
jgi:hypothetical protein